MHLFPGVYSQCSITSKYLFEINENELLMHLFPGVYSQCPENYAFVGEKCLLFERDAPANYSSAREVCQLNGGDLAIVDDCALLGDIAAYIYANGEFTG